MVFTSSNGYMFSQLNKAGDIGISLSKEDTQYFSEHYTVTPFMSYGSKMKDYVLIPDDALEKNLNFVAYLLQKSFDYVNSLPTK